ncbi:hypothetical protein UY416_15870 [Paenibacillus polymyxa]|nr:hypothetical protein [Paenibacillus polymyxa]MDY8047767.1 hypothetical protein [Paenibacillus polymyxa]
MEKLEILATTDFDMEVQGNCTGDCRHDCIEYKDYCSSNTYQGW